MFKMKMLLTATIFSFIGISTGNLTTQEICMHPSKLLRYWKCMLRSLPEYSKVYHLFVADCIMLIKTISNINDALVYFTCMDESELTEIKNCVNRRHPANIFISPTSNDEKKTRKVAHKCFLRCFSDEIELKFNKNL
ncbi:uncharacterized protein [Centruroides vittatus]|uniref:uncharacterized protein n=1 Tax=Centruroides vittatus TaxID=120091 RepID=UPI00350EA4B0